MIAPTPRAQRMAERNKSTEQQEAVMAEVIERTAFEELLLTIPGGGSVDGRTRYGVIKFSVSGYTRDGDCVRGTHVFEQADTLVEAVQKYRAAFAEAEAQSVKLRTAAECKAAVLDLIREHDAAPAAFRDAVDDLRVA
jgi:hypothetical protein